MEGNLSGTIVAADNQAQAGSIQPVTQTPDMVQSAPADNVSWQDRISQMFESPTGNNEPQQQTVPNEPQPQAQTTQQQDPQPQPQPDNLILGKFKSTEDVFTGYKNLESDYGRKSQLLSETQKAAETLKSENDRLIAELNQLRQPQQAQQQQIQQEEPVDPEKFLSEFYEKPQDVIAQTVKKLVEESVNNLVNPLKQQIQPVIEHTSEQIRQQNWDNTVQDFYKTNTDMPEFKDDMRSYIESRGLNTESDPAKISQALQDAYYYARGLKYQPQQQIDPKSFLTDQNFVNQNILQNQEIVNAVLKNYMQQIKDNQPPATITGHNAGQGPVMPPTKPKNLDEANNMLMEMLRSGHA